MQAEHFFILQLTANEAKMLHRVFCSGLIGGDPTVRSKLYDKIAALNRTMTTQGAKTIDGQAENGRAASRDIVPASAVRFDARRLRRTARNSKRQNGKAPSSVRSVAE
jgi:hypothetical protein